MESESRERPVALPDRALGRYRHGVWRFPEWASAVKPSAGVEGRPADRAHVLVGLHPEERYRTWASVDISCVALDRSASYSVVAAVAVGARTNLVTS